jgi:hypothetical protein
MRRVVLTRSSAGRVYPRLSVASHVANIYSLDELNTTQREIQALFQSGDLKCLLLEVPSPPLPVN